MTEQPEPGAGGPPAPTVKLATPAERDHLSEVLARAFLDDPVWTWLFPDPATSEKRLRLTFRAYLKDAMNVGSVFTTPDLQGAALWKPPGEWKLGNMALVRAAPELLRAFGMRLFASLQIERAVESQHPRDPHWYLAVLGTDPTAQGKGIGGALIRQVTDRCDRIGLPCYLESSKDRNVPYYERFGFEVTGETQLGKEGPTIWFMWRDPQVPETD
ncbi:MAG TPA: GNAT family N-acetyltransferase [Acidimicrobiales bacterium]|nr:GNAT family N-acetyltransferase [Acidimicrobiales bacterium]